MISYNEQCTMKILTDSDCYRICSEVSLNSINKNKAQRAELILVRFMGTNFEGIALYNYMNCLMEYCNELHNRK